MNHEHLMKFTLRQIEMERKSKLKSKNTLLKKGSNFIKCIIRVIK
jgi:hypothetical protein